MKPWVLSAATFILVISCFLNAQSFRDTSSGSSNTNELEIQIEPVVLASEMLGSELATINLVCARGLSTKKAADEAACLTLLDAWVERVKSETEKRHSAFTRRPDYYDNSEAKFQMIQLVLTLQEDCGVQYIEERVGVPDDEALRDVSFFRDSSDVFLTGVLGPGRRGTCASLPVLVVAVGRRLGYPLTLVATKGHVFARWESPEEGEVFNIETAGRGVDFPPNDRYRRWPFRLTPQEISEEGFLRSFGPSEELAYCLELRGYCLIANGRHAEATEALMAALKLRPRSRNLQALVEMSMAAVQRELERGGT